MKKLGIVTVSFNGRDDTRDLLESAKKLNTKGFLIKWIVVDNGSDKEPIPLEWEKKYGVEIIQTGDNLGFAGGYNRGMKYAYRWGAEQVLIINNDTLIGDLDLLIKMHRELGSRPQAGLVSPKILFAPGYEFHRDRYSPDQKGKVIWYAGGRFDWANVEAKHTGIDEVDRGQYDQIRETEFVSGCCLLVSREYLEKVGFFRDELFAYFEDGDWIMRGKAAGFGQVYCGTTWMYHKVSRTSGVGSPTTDYLLTRNRLWFGFKYASLRTKLALARQAAGFIWSGRVEQKRGVVDFVNGKSGGPKKSLSGDIKSRYPVCLSVVVLNYKTSRVLEQLLASLKKFGLPGMETVVLDNSPEDSAAEVIGKHPEVKYILAEKNLGFPAGNNAAIEYTRGRHILLLNSDIEVTPGSLAALVKAAEEREDKAVVAGKLKFGDGSWQDSCFYLPTVWGAIQEYFLNRRGRYFLFRPQTETPVQVEGAVMACLLIPRRVFNRAGELWTKVFIYFEDIEYCRRLKELGVPVYYIPEAVFIHHHGMASKAAGQTQSNKWLVAASKVYHGQINYWMLYVVLWWGQRIGLTQTPKSRWKESLD